MMRGLLDNTLFILYIYTQLIVFFKKGFKTMNPSRASLHSPLFVKRKAMCMSDLEQGCEGHFQMRLEQTALPCRERQLLANCFLLG